MDNNKADIQEVGWGDMDWIALAQDRDRLRGISQTFLHSISVYDAAGGYRLFSKTIDATSAR